MKLSLILSFSLCCRNTFVNAHQFNSFQKNPPTPPQAMSPNALYNSLLRPSILHILRAAGFHATRPAVLDTLVDIAIRYLTFLATKTASHASMNRNDQTPTIMDVRMALRDAGALHPQIGVMEEQCRQEEDLRGVKTFVDWMQGEVNHEIRRVAGLATTPGEPVVDIDALETGKEDFLTGGLALPPFFSFFLFRRSFPRRGGHT